MWADIKPIHKINMYHNGYRKKDLAEIFGRSYNSIEKRLIRTTVKEVSNVRNI